MAEVFRTRLNDSLQKFYPRTLKLKYKKNTALNDPNGLGCKKFPMQAERWGLDLCVSVPKRAKLSHEVVIQYTAVAFTRGMRDQKFRTVARLRRLC